MAPTEVEQPSERSPLLGSQSQAVNGQAVDTEAQPADPEHDGVDEVVLAEEVSTKKLLAIFTTTFVGVFFAALGKFAHGNAMP